MLTPLHCLPVCFLLACLPACSLYNCADRCAPQAFYLARTGRPGPVLVDVPKDIQQQLDLPDWDTPMAISGYMSRWVFRGCVDVLGKGD